MALVKPAGLGLVRYRSKILQKDKLPEMNSILEQIKADLAPSSSGVSSAENPKDYWTNWKNHPNRTAAALTFEQKCQIISCANLEDAKERELFFRHLETDAPKTPDTSFAAQLFTNPDQYPQKSIIINKLKAYLTDQAHVDALIKKCPKVVQAMASIDLPVVAALPQVSTHLSKLAQENRFVAFALFSDPSVIAKEKAKQKSVLADVYADPNAIAAIFGQEETELENPGYFLDKLRFFQKYRPEQLGHLLAQIALEEAENKPLAEPGADAAVKGRTQLRQHLFAANAWIAQLPKAHRPVARKHNEECAQFLMQHPQLSKLLYSVGLEKPASQLVVNEAVTKEQTEKDVKLSSNIVKLLSLSSSPYDFAVHLAKTRVKGESILTDPAIGRLAPHMAQTFPTKFSKWWGKLGSSARRFTDYIKQKLTSYATLPTAAEVEIVNAALAENAIRGKVRFFSQSGTKHAKVENIDAAIIALLDQEVVDPLVAKGLAYDGKLWPMLQKHYGPKNNTDATETKAYAKFLHKSPHFYAQACKINIIDLILNRGHDSRKYPAISEEDYKKVQASFQKVFGKGKLDQYIAADNILIGQLLAEATPSELCSLLLNPATNVTLSLTLNASLLISKAIVVNGYLDKILIYLGQENGIKLADKPKFYYSLLSWILKLELTQEQKNYVIEYFRPRLAMAQLHELANQYPELAEQFYATEERHQTWLLLDHNAVDLKHEDTDTNEVISYVKSLVNKVPREQRDEALLKAVIYLANNAEEGFLGDLLKYTWGVVRAASVQQRITRYLDTALEGIAAAIKAEQPISIDLALKLNLEACVKNRLLRKQLNFSGEQLYALTQIPNLDPLCYKAIGNDENLWKELYNFAKKNHSALNNLCQKSPYFYINGKLKPAQKKDEKFKVNYLAQLILNENSAENPMHDFVGVQRNFAAAFPVDQLNPLFERDAALREAIFNQYLKNKAETSFNLIKQYSALLPFAFAKIDFDGAQLIAISIAHPQLKILQNAAQRDKIIAVILDPCKVVDNDLIKDFFSNEENLLAVMQALKAESVEAILKLAVARPALQVHITQRPEVWQQILNAVLQVNGDAIAFTNAVLTSRDIDQTSLSKAVSDFSVENLIHLVRKLPALAGAQFITNVLAQLTHKQQLAMAVAFPALADSIIKVFWQGIADDYIALHAQDLEPTDAAAKEIPAFSDEEESLLVRIFNQYPEKINLLVASMPGAAKAVTWLAKQEARLTVQSEKMAELLKIETFVYSLLQASNKISWDIVSANAQPVFTALLQVESVTEFNKLFAGEAIVLQLIKSFTPAQCVAIAVKYENTRAYFTNADLRKIFTTVESAEQVFVAVPAFLIKLLNDDSEEGKQWRQTLMQTPILLQKLFTAVLANKPAVIAAFQSKTGLELIAITKEIPQFADIIVGEANLLKAVIEVAFPLKAATVESESVKQAKALITKADAQFITNVLAQLTHKQQLAMAVAFPALADSIIKEFGQGIADDYIAAIDVAASLADKDDVSLPVITAEEIPAFSDEEESLLVRIFNQYPEKINLLVASMPGAAKAVTWLAMQEARLTIQSEKMAELLKIETFVYSLLQANNQTSWTIVSANIQPIFTALLLVESVTEFNKLFANEAIVLQLIKSFTPAQCAAIAVKYENTRAYFANNISLLLPRDERGQIILDQAIEVAQGLPASLLENFKEALLTNAAQAQLFALAAAMPEWQDDILALPAEKLIDNANYQALAEQSEANAFVRQILLKHFSYVEKLLQEKGLTTEIATNWLNDDGFVDKLTALHLVAFLKYNEPAIIEKTIVHITSKADLFTNADLHEIFSIESAAQVFVAVPAFLIKLLNDNSEESKQWRQTLVQTPFLLQKLFTAVTGNKDIADVFQAQCKQDSFSWGLQLLSLESATAYDSPILKPIVLAMLQDKQFYSEILAKPEHQPIVLRIFQSTDTDISLAFWRACGSASSLLLNVLTDEKCTEEIIKDQAKLFAKTFNQHAEDIRVMKLTEGQLRKFIAQEDTELCRAVLGNKKLRKSLEKANSTSKTEFTNFQKDIINDIDGINYVEDIFLVIDTHVKEGKLTDLDNCFNSLKTEMREHAVALVDGEMLRTGAKETFKNYKYSFESGNKNTNPLPRNPSSHSILKSSSFSEAAPQVIQATERETKILAEMDRNVKGIDELAKAITAQPAATSDENTFYQAINSQCKKLSKLKPKENTAKLINKILDEFKETAEKNNKEDHAAIFASKSKSWLIVAKACVYALTLINSNNQIVEIAARKTDFVKLLGNSLQEMLIASNEYQKQGKYFLASSYVEECKKMLAENKDIPAATANALKAQAETIQCNILKQKLAEFQKHAAIQEQVSNWLVASKIYCKALEFIEQHSEINPEKKSIIETLVASLKKLLEFGELAAKQQKHYFLAKTYCEEVKAIVKTWLVEANAETDAEVETAEGSKLCFLANVALLNIFIETGDAEGKVPGIFKTELLQNSAISPEDFATLPASWLANDMIFNLLSNNNNIEDYYNKIKAYLDSINQPNAVNKERIERLTYLIARHDFIVECNQLTAENIKSAADFLAKYFIEHHKVYENLSVAAEVVLATGNLDLILYFLRRPELSQQWMQNEEDKNEILNAARQPKYKIIAQCLFYYDHLNLDNNSPARLEELAVLIGLSDKKIKQIKKPASIAPPNVQPSPVPAESSFSQTMPKKASEEAAVMPVVSSNNTPHLQSQPISIPVSIPLKDDNKENTSEKAATAEPLSISSNAPDDASQSTSSAPPPPPPPPMDMPGPPPPPPMGIPSGTTGETNNNSLPLMPNNGGKQEQTRLRKVFYTIFDKKSTEKTLQASDVFIKGNFGYDVVKMAGITDQESDAINKKLETFNVKIAPAMGKLVEQIQQGKLQTVEAAWEFFKTEIDFAAIELFNDSENLEDKQKQFYNKKFTALFKTIYPAIQTKYKALFECALEKTARDEMLKNYFGYEVLIRIRESLMQQHGLKSKWPFDREKFDLDIAPWLGRIVERLQADAALPVEKLQANVAWTVEQAFEWFKSVVKPENINSQGYGNKWDENAFLEQAFKPMFAQLKEAVAKHKKAPKKVLALKSTNSGAPEKLDASALAEALKNPKLRSTQAGDNKQKQKTETTKSQDPNDLANLIGGAMKSRRAHIEEIEETVSNSQPVAQKKGENKATSDVINEWEEEEVKKPAAPVKLQEEATNEVVPPVDSNLVKQASAVTLAVKRAVLGQSQTAAPTTTGNQQPLPPVNASPISQPRPQSQNFASRPLSQSGAPGKRSQPPVEIATPPTKVAGQTNFGVTLRRTGKLPAQSETPSVQPKTPTLT